MALTMLPSPDALRDLAAQEDAFFEHWTLAHTWWVLWALVVIVGVYLFNLWLMGRGGPRHG